MAFSLLDSPGRRDAVGLEEDDLVPRIEKSEAGGVEGARRARGHDDLSLRIRLDVIVLAGLRGDGLAQRGETVESRVAVDSRIDRAVGTLEHDRGRLGIADALGEVDAIDPLALDAHVADLGLQDPIRPLARC